KTWTASAFRLPVTEAPSPITILRLWMSPLTTPSIWISPLHSRSPVIRRSALMIDGTLPRTPGLRAWSTTELLRCALSPLENIATCLQKTHRIERFVVVADFVMHVRTRTAAGGTEQSENITIVHRLSLLDGNLVEMRIEGVDAETVIDLDH